MKFRHYVENIDISIFVVFLLVMCEKQQPERKEDEEEEESSRAPVTAHARELA